MKNNDLRRKRLLYGKLLTTITLCISLTLLISTFVYYTYYIGVEKTQTFRSDLRDLTQTGKKVVNMAEVAQTLSFQLYRTSTISHLLFYNKPSIYEVTAAMSDLGNYLNSMPYIESIYVYNPNNDTVYISAAQGQNGVFTTRELVDTEIIQMLNHYQDYKTFTPIPRTYSIDEPEKKTSQSILTFAMMRSIGTALLTLRLLLTYPRLGSIKNWLTAIHPVVAVPTFWMTKAVFCRGIS